MVWKEDLARLGDVADAVDEGLERLRASGLRRGRGDRFQIYCDHLRVASTCTFPGPLPWSDPHDKALFYEAAAQCPMLLTALELAPHVDPERLCSKVEEVLSGRALPAGDPRTDDKARNYLLELAVGGLLQRYRFTIALIGDADLTASFPGGAPFVVECTRPAHADSLRKGLKHVHKQLRARKVDGVNALGFPVLGFDRIFGLAGPRAFRNRSHLETAVTDALTVAKRQTRKMQGTIRPPFFPWAPLAAIALVAGVFLEDTGVLYFVGQLAAFCTGSERDPRSIELLQRLSAHVPFTSGGGMQRMTVGSSPAMRLAPVQWAGTRSYYSGRSG